MPALGAGPPSGLGPALFPGRHAARGAREARGRHFDREGGPMDAEDVRQLFMGELPRP